MVGARQPPFRTFTVEMTPMLGVQEDGDLALEVRSPSKASWLFAGDFGQHHKSNSHVPPETWEFVFSLKPFYKWLL